MSAGKKKKKSDSLGVKIVDGKTVIQYANGILTEDGFEIDTEYDDSTEGVCHLISDDMLYYNKTKNFIRYYTSYIDLNMFARFCIESENLLDGFLWGIALNTWFVISKQLNESKCPTPVVFL